MSINRRNHILHDIALLLPQGGDCGKDSLGKTAALVALITKAAFTPQDGAPQSPLRPIIGRFDAGHEGKGEQGGPKFQEIAAEGLGLGVTAGHTPAQQSSQTGAYRHQLPLHFGPVDFAGLITMPDGKEPFDLSQPPGSQRTSTSLPFGQGLEVSFQMRPAQLATATVHDIIGAPAVAMQNARKICADQLKQGLAATRARNQKHRHQIGDPYPQPTPLPLFFPAGFVHKGGLGLGHRVLGFLVGSRQGRGGLFTQGLYAAQTVG